jgi:hypothetical protein
MGILKTQRITSNYLGECGCFLTDELYVAENFGNYIVNIDGIDESILKQDEVNDGFYHDGILELAKYSYTISSIPCDRTEMDGYNQLELTLLSGCINTEQIHGLQKGFSNTIINIKGIEFHDAYRRLYPTLKP